MAGIYIHIPFCKQACHYCNFHFSTQLKYKNAIFNAILQEAEARKSYLQNQIVETIYLGGGTPSLLSIDELNILFDILAKHYDLSDLKEVTIEANPDDLTKDYLNELKSTAINRLSVGIQSFFDEDLQFMNRAHNAKEAAICIQLAKDAGFIKFSIDLIYGIPKKFGGSFEKNLDRFFELDVDHLSAYNLTVEAKTPLAKMIEKEKAPAVDELQSANEMNYLMNAANQHNYEHYEISNFARDNKYAIHNTSYWSGKHYLGLGPAAHSYNGESRQWNVANNQTYQKAIEKGDAYFEIEQLTEIEKLNELLLTGLRTKWGFDLAHIEQLNSENKSDFNNQLENYIIKNKAHLINEYGFLKLTQAGKLYADNIAAELFLEGNNN